ncbi:MAG: PRC-barrel domain-containing protein [Coriobacteriaceae bacterium]|nr:PRC-barrel domain-containing protein [Coriobacteriaceae bacterium]
MSEESLLSVVGLLNKKVYVPHKKKEDASRRIGKVRRFVFHPTEKRVIGFIVKRPDVALMFHRADQFVAIDRVEVLEEGILVDPAPGTFDQAACRRFGVEWAKCLLWLGMEIVTEDGETLGRVGDIVFEAGTGRVVSIRRNEGATARWLLGVEEIPSNMIRGFRFGVGSQMADYQNDEAGGDGSSEDASEEAENSGAIVVSNAVRTLDPQGGLAEKAGAATARAAQKGKDALSRAKEQGAEVAAKAKVAAEEKTGAAMEDWGEKAEDALNRGAYATGRQIGRAKGMFGDFLSEYRKARDGEDE